MEKKKSKPLIIALCVLVIFIGYSLFLIISSNVNKDKIPDIFGYKPFFVVSGSMADTINTGDLIIVKEVNENEIKKGDIIAFKYEDYVVTHRVVNVINDDNGLYFKTKGDNNNLEDDFNVKPDSLEGIMVKRIPKIGSVLMFMATPSGTIIIILLAVIIFGFCYYAFSKSNEKELLKELEEYKKKL